MNDEPATQASQPAPQPNQVPNQAPGRLPYISKRLGEIQMAAWPGAFGWNFRIDERVYRTQDGQTKKTQYLRPQDLSNLQHVIEFMLHFALTTPLPSQDNDEPPPA